MKFLAGPLTGFVVAAAGVGLYLLLDNDGADASGVTAGSLAVSVQRALIEEGESSHVTCRGRGREWVCNATGTTSGGASGDGFGPRAPVPFATAYRVDVRPNGCWTASDGIDQWTGCVR